MNLIINADDFGRTEAINAAILDLYKAGIVSSATVMSNGTCFEHAVQLAREYPQLGVGVHLCLDGPFNSSPGPSSVIEPSTGRFYDKDAIIQRIKALRVNQADVYREYCLQIEKVLDHGLQISHLDHHHHLHLYFPVLAAVIRAAKKYRIPFVRSQIMLFPEDQGFLNRFYRLSHQQILRFFSHTTAGYFEPCICSESDFDQAYLRLERMVRARGGCAEIMLHPLNSFDPETLFFRSEKVKVLLKEVALLNYNNLQR